MFLFFTPYSFIYLSIYSLFFLLLFTTPNFVIFWAFIELIMLLFMGLSYTLFTNSYSYLVVYFLIQTFSSFCILLTYLFSSPLLFTFSLLLKLGMFPFHFWFLNIAYRFPNFLLLMISSLHKLPVFIIISSFSLPLHSTSLWLSIVVSTFISGVLMLSINDFRMVLISSSIGNNSWFIISLFINSFTFSLFFLSYTLFLFMVFFSLGSLTKPSSTNVFSTSVFTVALSGLPPFPLFFLKIFIIFQLIRSDIFNLYVFMFFVSRALVLSGYLQVLIKYFIYSYTSSSSFLLRLN